MQILPASISEHLPVLQIVLPLMAAPVCTLLWRARAAWWITLVATWVAFGISLLLLARVLTEGTISYEIGDWAAPWGIEYRVDTLNAFVLVIMSAIGAVVAPYARRSVEKEVDPDRIPLFYTMYLLFLAGLLGITITGDIFNVYVFLEISSLSTYVLISMGEDRRALTAADSYLIRGSVGATFIVIGIGLMYAMTGTLNIADLAVRLPAVADTRTVPVAFAFLTVGVSLKLALFPLHLWLPNAYTYAPSAVSALVASTATKMAVYLLLRFFFTIFGVTFAFETLNVDLVLVPLALIAAVTTSLVAIFQSNAKRLLAYSSLAQVGYIVLGISFGTVTGLTAGILHIFNHALMKGALFMALGCVFYRIGTVEIDAMRGLGRRMPWTMGAFVAGGLSLIGVPLTVGFISKWYLILGALEKGWWPVAAIVLFTSLLAAIYIWRVVEAAYFRPAPEGTPAGMAEAPLSLLIPTWALIAANYYFGIDASFTASVARLAATNLLGIGR